MRVLEVLIVVALTSLACSGHTVPNTLVTADKGVVLTGERLKRRCSRSGPGDVEGTWTPDEDVIAELEARALSSRRGAVTGSLPL